jgi:hypothetical protein
MTGLIRQLMLFHIKAMLKDFSLIPIKSGFDRNDMLFLSFRVTPSTRGIEKSYNLRPLLKEEFLWYNNTTKCQRILIITLNIRLII